MRVSFVALVLALSIAVSHEGGDHAHDCLAVLGPVKPLRVAPSLKG